jgi:hypothetical protein
MNWDSSVCKVTTYRLDDWSSICNVYRNFHQQVSSRVLDP